MTENLVAAEQIESLIDRLDRCADAVPAGQRGGYEFAAEQLRMMRGRHWKRSPREDGKDVSESGPSTSPPITLTNEQREALEAWVTTTDHLYDCIGYSEGQECCLERLLDQQAAPDASTTTKGSSMKGE